MGNSASTAGPGDREVSTDGFRVLSVQPNSPASDIIVFPSAEAARDGLRAPLHASLISYLDFIVSVNGEALTEESEWFADEIKANVDQPVILEIFNYKWGKFRTVQVVPRSNWGGEGLLGLHVRFDSMEKAAESVLHVVDVAPGSPAADAGLVAADDFILGSAEGSFESVGRPAQCPHIQLLLLWAVYKMYPPLAGPASHTACWDSIFSTPVSIISGGRIW